MIVALAGGVGGAKLAAGLARVLPPEELVIAVNTGDDFEHLGLHVSPDLDTVMYTLAGIANPETGWGQADETWSFMGALSRLGGPDWFKLGDRDLATNVERTRRLRGGETLSAITRDLCARLGVRHAVVPMSDDPVRTDRAHRPRRARVPALLRTRPVRAARAADSSIAALKRRARARRCARRSAAATSRASSSAPRTLTSASRRSWPCPAFAKRSAIARWRSRRSSQAAPSRDRPRRSCRSWVSRRRRSRSRATTAESCVHW